MIITTGTTITKEEWGRLYEAGRHPNLDPKSSATCPQTGGDHEDSGMVGTGHYPGGSVTHKRACGACAQTLSEVLVRGPMPVPHRQSS